MAMLKEEIGRLPARGKGDRMRHVPVVVSSQRNDFAAGSQPFQEGRGRRARRAIVHQIPYDDELARLVFCEQFRETLLDRLHAPKWHEPPRGTLAELVAEVQISNRKPAFRFMKKRQTPVKENVRRDRNLIGGGGGHRHLGGAEAEIIPCHPSLQPISRLSSGMKGFLKFLGLSAVALLGIGCAMQAPHPVAQSSSSRHRINKVRTTAYTHTEAGGRSSAIGTRLCGKKVKSAAADWSRWPLGTKFQIVGTDEIFQIDDYGGALVGTSTIDLYKTNRLEMHKWGVRAVDIDILEWGSAEKSMKVLAPRAHNSKVHAMIMSLAKNAAGRENTHLSPAFF